MVLVGKQTLVGAGVEDGSRLAVLRHAAPKVLTASEDRTAKIWSTVTGECTMTFRGHKAQVISAVFAPDGETVLTASNDRTAKTWSTATGECIMTFHGHTGGVC